MGYLCIHGHFYQPPRENPWLEEIEPQESAAPYHDWNERITAECYAANLAAGILDAEGQIARLVNNYTRLSFDFGPTLLAWMERHAPDTYQAILAADRETRRTFSGHGSALAHPYNHMILPLANERDKYTQILWGLRDFRHRFGRRPEGMWLPETAVDLETLDLAAAQGIRFTILGPHQVRRVRRIGSRHWRDVSGGRIDPTMAYALCLPSGRTISLFFYDGPISQAVGLEGLLHDANRLVDRLLGAFVEDRAWPELVHVATDGETFGHHHRRGEMALAYALERLQREDLAQVTNYGEYLERHPPSHVVEIAENTSWSCVHGVERWRSDCGCNSGSRPGWSQAWRAPLRNALDWLRDAVAERYELLGSRLFTDPWEARNGYIDVLLDRTLETYQDFLSRHARRKLDGGEQVTALQLLEMQRYAMLMYASCAWFFDELSGPEAVQALRCAGRVVQLAEELSGEPLEPAFLERLEQAKCNFEEHRDGRCIYQKWVRPAMVSVRPAPGGFWHLLAQVRAQAAVPAAEDGPHVAPEVEGVIEALDRQMSIVQSVCEAYARQSDLLAGMLKILARDLPRLLASRPRAAPETGAGWSTLADWISAGPSSYAGHAS